MDIEIFDKIIGFEWDSGNKGKNLTLHQVTDEECEEVFFDQDKKILKDILHSENEKRQILIGQTKRQRLMFLVFTVRKNFIRVISARDLKRKERKLYEEKN